jgi:hypothetical protein
MNCAKEYDSFCKLYTDFVNYAREKNVFSYYPWKQESQVRKLSVENA